MPHSRSTVPDGWEDLSCGDLPLALLEGVPLMADERLPAEEEATLCSRGGKRATKGRAL